MNQFAISIVAVEETPTTFKVHNYLCIIKASSDKSARKKALAKMRFDLKHADTAHPYTISSLQILPT